MVEKKKKATWKLDGLSKIGRFCAAKKKKKRTPQTRAPSALLLPFFSFSFLLPFFSLPFFPCAMSSTNTESSDQLDLDLGEFAIESDGEDEDIVEDETLNTQRGFTAEELRTCQKV